MLSSRVVLQHELVVVASTQSLAAKGIVAEHSMTSLPFSSYPAVLE